MRAFSSASIGSRKRGTGTVGIQRGNCGVVMVYSFSYFVTRLTWGERRGSPLKSTSATSKLSESGGASTMNR